MWFQENSHFVYSILKIGNHQANKEEMLTFIQILDQDPINLISLTPAISTTFTN